MPDKSLKIGKTHEDVSVELELGDGMSRKWIAAKPVRSVKRAVRDLDLEIQPILREARARKLTELRDELGKPDAEIPIGMLAELAELTDEEEDTVLELRSRQISALTKCVTENQEPLGEVLLQQWRDDALIDDEITGLVDDLIERLGKPNAS